MKKADVIRYFGSVKAAASRLGISGSAISQWPEDVPPLRAIQIEKVTGGALRADDSRAAAK